MVSDLHCSLIGARAIAPLSRLDGSIPGYVNKGDVTPASCEELHKGKSKDLTPVSSSSFFLWNANTMSSRTAAIVLALLTFAVVSCSETPPVKRPDFDFGTAIGCFFLGLSGTLLFAGSWAVSVSDRAGATQKKVAEWIGFVVALSCFFGLLSALGESNIGHCTCFGVGASPVIVIYVWAQF
jgi:hypothetical protein